MSLICKKCGSEYQEDNDRESICVDCNLQLDLLDEQLKINDQRIRKLQEHKKLELENPKSEEVKINLETMKRIEHNLQIEYKKREGIIKSMKSKEIF